MVNIRDVAKKAGVSIATVSATVNGANTVRVETRQRVLDAIEALGYRPNGVARSLRLGQTRVLGLVLPDITNPFSSEIARVIEEVALDASNVVVVCSTSNREAREAVILDALRVQRVAGLIIEPSGVSEVYGIALNATLPKEAVVIDRRVPGLARDFVGLDNHAAGRMAAEYLIRLGHRRIGFIGGIPEVSTATERLRGFRDAMQGAGLAVDDTLCIPAGYLNEPAIRAAAQMLTRTDRPTALIAANNLMALGVMQAVSSLGFHCPEQVSVAGIDDFAWSSALRPALTTVAQPIENIGRQAIEWLLERLGAAGDFPPRSIEFSPTLYVRDSCGSPPP